MKYFKYPSVEATIREPTMRLIRFLKVHGDGKSLDYVEKVVRSAYQHGRSIPRWLSDFGFYVAKFEDLKRKPKETLHTVCRIFNIPYTEKLLEGKVGVWYNPYGTDKQERLQGFDQRSLYWDISDMLPPEDKKRLDMYYWHIDRYFRYPCASDPPAKFSQNEAERLFSVPFHFEVVYAEQRTALFEALKTAASEDARTIQEIIELRYSTDPADIRALVQRVMPTDYLKGFDSELVLPTVMFPEDEMEWTLPQDQRLRLE